MWYVSFADMITLLLSFFVMLSSFSSYDNESLGVIAETSRRVGGRMVPVLSPHGQYGAVRPLAHVYGSAAYGSEKPGDQQKADTPPPVLPWIQDRSAYKRQKVICIPADKLFLGKGTALAPDSGRCIQLIGRFLANKPCQVVLSVSPPEQAEATSGELSALWLERQWVIAQRLAAEARLPIDRIGLSTGYGTTTPSSGEWYMVVSMFSKGEFE
jgi:hypothetical protein